MKLEAQLTSLKLSKKLRELGVKQDAFWSWYDTTDYDDIPRLNRSDENCPVCTLSKQTFEDKYSAFTVAELGEIGKLEMISWYNPRFEKWAVAREYDDQLRLYEDTEADARAKMLIYLIENKLIQI
jgi:hypothetical protein